MVEKGSEDDTLDEEIGENLGKETFDDTGKKLVNQFNFCEHSSQTYTSVPKVMEFGCQTEPPARNTFSGNVTQWGIYDFYRDVAANKVEGLSGFLKPLKTIERMINQNTFDDVLQDFAYFEDLADDFRDSMGTLLPLWKFSYEKAKKMTVTSLCWSPQYSDLFAVGLGSEDLVKHGGGLICFYSLKNPSYPEYIFRTESEVLCLDIHPEYPFLICVGFYDGAVGVYKLNQQKLGPLYLSTVNSNKNTDPVWQVKWLQSVDQPNLEFYSISSDGRISSWNIVKDDIVCYDILQMKTPKENSEELGNVEVFSHESGTALAFHRKNTEIFLIATEDGLVHKCSRIYGPDYLSTFRAHSMAVYKLSWNYFHEDIFITCSADWTVKIWHQDKKDPLFIFDLGSPVGDVAWAPYSSTVFAAVTNDGHAHIYDLNVNKYAPLCHQLIVKKKNSKLTQVAFNPVRPVIICGGDRLVQTYLLFNLSVLLSGVYNELIKSDFKRCSACDFVQRPNGHHGDLKVRNYKAESHC
ncbi:unnamed protein product [Rodentolepis nana]|uniref:WD_REPEATS_REGION domain-containing protein n=1 Tax=Rodentolepis nana TaxID=102285 RepID=A0A0R3TXS4_RODNA|nr:unnamed protein product [Rodentolepis nana]